MFKTLKYHPSYPERRFDSIEEARAWAFAFQHWYNTKPKHRAIKFVSPAERHARKDIEILKRRKKVYEKARQKHPERWSGKIRNFEPVKKVLLNPEKPKGKEVKNKEKVV